MNLEFERDFEKVLKTIKSVKKINQFDSCENLIELFRNKYQESDITDFDDTIIFFESELKSKKIKFNDL